MVSLAFVHGSAGPSCGLNVVELLWTDRIPSNRVCGFSSNKSDCLQSKLSYERQLGEGTNL